MKRALSAAIATFALITLFAPRARACFEPAVGPKNAISARLPTFFAHGVALSYERYLPTEGSVGVGLCVRKSAGGDYASTTVTATTEARWWPFGYGLFGCRGRYEMIGLYVGARLDVGNTSVTDRLEDRSIGNAWTIMTSSWLGYRFAFGRVEITPGLGAMIRTEVGGGLARYTTVVFGYDLTAGWMF